ncbi:class I SAM-dependent methyltransferase (plasmid) [Exiguobacterium sp. Helios]|uniref:class I SAM-dependent methyltransferase n=1 Tax=unclassified Exiguobacterium TaxID=2644629 RepID=UPI00165D9B6D|nr:MULTISPECIES: class I SAM-dependent methyltransferase [unclassified Exiguobacterium]QNR22513.1 class I SAM-dependent methyltransferase [Exiguobacterium sp. Helios]
MAQLLVEEIKKFNYVDLLSYIGEVNRCPGGKRTILEIVKNTNLKPGARILEIGSNTGFTSIEIAKLIDCEITGIDVNENAVKKSNELLLKEPEFVQKRVNFIVGDAQKIPFEDETFDLIITGGANTFIPSEGREVALSEYKRVLKPYGMLSVTNLFYHSPVPAELLKDLKSVLGFEIKPWTENYWLKLILSSGLELFYHDSKKMQARSEEILSSYVDKLIQESFENQEIEEDVLQEFKSQWYKVMETFNENHRYLSFLFVILRKNVFEEQQELFIEEGAIDPWNIDGPDLWTEKNL